MCNQLLLSVLETVRTAESRSHDLTANPVALTQLTLLQCVSSSSCSWFVLLLAWISLLIQFLLLAMMNSSDHYSKQILAKLISTWRWLFSLLFSFFNVCYVSNGLLGDKVSFLTGLHNSYKLRKRKSVWKLPTLLILKSLYHQDKYINYSRNMIFVAKK